MELVRPGLVIGGTKRNITLADPGLPGCKGGPVTYAVAKRRRLVRGNKVIPETTREPRGQPIPRDPLFLSPYLPPSLCPRPVNFREATSDSQMGCVLRIGLHFPCFPSHRSISSTLSLFLWSNVSSQFWLSVSIKRRAEMLINWTSPGVFDHATN